MEIKVEHNPSNERLEALANNWEHWLLDQLRVEVAELVRLG